MGRESADFKRLFLSKTKRKKEKIVYLKNLIMNQQLTSAINSRFKNKLIGLIKK